MKLIVAVIQPQDEELILNALREHNFRATEFASTGGFLKRGNITLLIGVQDDRVDEAIDLLHNVCHRRVEHVERPAETEASTTDGVCDVEVAGVVVWVLNLDPLPASEGRPATA